jgi:RNA polymerase primary sigma factor
MTTQTGGTTHLHAQRRAHRRTLNSADARTRLSQNDGAAIADYMHVAGRYALLSATEEADLAAQVQQGDTAARNTLVTHNLRLVVWVAERYLSATMPLDDLIGYGNLGLLRAVEKYDPARGRFSTYATWWIRQAITRALAEHRGIVHIPSHMAYKLTCLAREQARLFTELGRDATVAELADACQTTEETIWEWLTWHKTTEEIASLDAPQADSAGQWGDDALTLGDIIEDPRYAVTDDDLERDDLRALVARALARIPAREAEVLRARFGIMAPGAVIGDDDDLQGCPQTLDEIAQRMSRTRERVRQIEQHGLRHLKAALLSAGWRHDDNDDDDAQEEEVAS